MTNRFRRVQVLTRSLSPVEAVLTVAAEAERTTPKTELRGRLAGPTCPYASTIEVAYPMQAPPNAEALTARVVIPEPSLWDPISPFLYHGLIELWHDGELCDRATVRHGLRSFRLQPEGLRWNGKPLKLRISSKPDLVPNDLPALRLAGFNALLLDWPSRALLEAAEQIGFAVLAKLSSSIGDSSMFAHSAALLAWVLPADWRSNERDWQQWLGAQRQLIGIQDDGGPVPQGTHFLIGGPDTRSELPRLLQGADGELGRLE